MFFVANLVVFPAVLGFCAHICLHKVIPRLTHRFGGSNPLGWVSPCSESNLAHLPTSHKVTSECFVCTILFLPPHVNVLVDFYALEWKQSQNKRVCGGTAAIPQVIFWLCCWSWSDGNEVLEGVAITCPLVSSLLTLPTTTSGEEVAVLNFEMDYELFISSLPKPR